MVSAQDVAGWPWQKRGLRRYSVPCIDFGTSPIAAVLVDESDGTVYLAGIVAEDIVAVPERPLETVNASNATERETLLVLGAVRDVFASLGMTMQDVVSCLVHLKDLDDFDSMNTAFRAFFGAGGPARTTVQAAELIFGTRVEITIVAKRRPRTFPWFGTRTLPAGPALSMAK